MARGQHDVLKQQVVNDIRFDIPNVDFGVGGCVYKLYYGDRYIIQKGKTLSGSLFLLQKGYSYFVGYDHKEGTDQNTHFRKLYQYIKSHPELPFRYEILLQSENGYQLLKAEQQALDACLKDKKCLNNNLTSYIPKFRPNLKMYGWIKPAHVSAFKRFLNKR